MPEQYVQQHQQHLAQTDNNNDNNKNHRVKKFNYSDSIINTTIPTKYNDTMRVYCFYSIS